MGGLGADLDRPQRQDGERRDRKRLPASGGRRARAPRARLRRSRGPPDPRRALAEVNDPRLVPDVRGRAPAPPPRRRPSPAPRVRRPSTRRAAAALPQAISMPASSRAEAFGLRLNPVASVIRRGQTISRSRNRRELDEQPVAPRPGAAAGVGRAIPLVGDLLALGQLDIRDRAWTRTTSSLRSTIATRAWSCRIADEEGDPCVIVDDQRRLSGHLEHQVGGARPESTAATSAAVRRAKKSTAPAETRSLKRRGPPRR